MAQAHCGYWIPGFNVNVYVLSFEFHESPSLRGTKGVQSGFGLSGGSLPT